MQAGKLCKSCDENTVAKVKQQKNIIKLYCGEYVQKYGVSDPHSLKIHTELPTKFNF